MGEVVNPPATLGVPGGAVAGVGSCVELLSHRCSCRAFVTAAVPTWLGLLA